MSSGRPWWKVPSRNWNWDSNDDGFLGLAAAWKERLDPDGQYGYDDYQNWLADLQARGLLDASGEPVKQYYEVLYNQSFNPVYNAQGEQTGTQRDSNYQPYVAGRTNLGGGVSMKAKTGTTDPYADLRPATAGPSVAGSAYAAQARTRQEATAAPPKRVARTLGGY